MEFNQQDPLFQVQNYLNELSFHINKINYIIIQMNSFINNQINSSQLSKDMNAQMNNFMMMNNNSINFNMNMNNNLFPNIQENDDNLIEKIRTDNLINIVFNYNEKHSNIQTVNKKLSINDLLNLYFKKINKIEYINNYNKFFHFYYNGKIINNSKEIIENILKDNSVITVLDKHSV